MATLLRLCVFVSLLICLTHAQGPCRNVQRRITATSFRPKCDANGFFQNAECFGHWCLCVYRKTGKMVGMAFLKSSASSPNERCACDLKVYSGGRRKDCNTRTYSTCLHNLVNVLKTRRGVPRDCDHHGHYEAVSCYQDSCICTRATQFTHLGYSGKRNSGMNCLCARDEEKMGKKLDCAQNGNYPPSSKTTPSPQQKTCTDRKPTRCAKRARDANEDPAKHCDARGLYVPVQCFGNSCYCADPVTGHRLGRYAFNKDSIEAKYADCQCAVEEAMYDRTGEKLSANCESNGNYLKCSMALAMFKYAAYDGMIQPRCHCSGWYMPRQCNARGCHCVSKYGHTIEKYRGPPSRDMKCECAREEDRLRATGKLGMMSRRCNRYGDYDL